MGLKLERVCIEHGAYEVDPVAVGGCPGCMARAAPKSLQEVADRLGVPLVKRADLSPGVRAQMASVTLLRPEYISVAELLREVGEAHPGAECAVVVVFDHGVMRAYRKASSEMTALAGAHLLHNAVT